MKAKDTEGQYTIAITTETAQLIGDILGSELADRIVSSLFSANERPSERNIQTRLREALRDRSLRVKGLTAKRQKSLDSALRLGKLLYTDEPEVGTVIDDEAVAAQAFHEIAWEPVEKFAVLALDVKHRLLSTRIVSSGTATETLAHPREIFKWVIQVGGLRCIMGHNHPSASLEPSQTDLELTKQLIKSGNLLGIPVLDHIIVTGTEHISIRQHSDLWEEE